MIVGVNPLHSAAQLKVFLLRNCDLVDNGVFYQPKWLCTCFKHNMLGVGHPEGNEGIPKILGQRTRLKENTRNSIIFIKQIIIQ